jgi:streptogrisin D
VENRYSKRGRRALIALAAGVAASGALALPTAGTAGAAPVATPASASPGGHADAGSATVRRAEAAALAAGTGVNTATAATRVAAQRDQSALAGTLSSRLGAKAAGSYLQDGKLVVNVTDSAAASTVTSAGATAKVVTRTSAELAAVTAALAKSKVAGTAWGVDPRTNQVVLTVTSAAPAAKAATLLATAKRYGSAVRVQRSGAGFGTQIQGGDAIYTDTGGRCSAGFNTTGGVVTAGHCTAGYPSWTVSGGGYLGESAGSSFPGDDYGLITNSGQPASPSVNLYDGTSQTISGAGDAVVGQSICKSGSTTGLTCGTVHAVNVTVNYAEGSVYGMVQTDVCTQPGDSGGSWFSGSTAIGITSGGTIGGCGAGFQSFFQPVTEALGAYGVSLI